MSPNIYQYQTYCLTSFVHSNNNYFFVKLHRKKNCVSIWSKLPCVTCNTLSRTGWLKTCPSTIAESKNGFSMSATKCVHKTGLFYFFFHLTCDLFILLFFSEEGLTPFLHMTSLVQAKRHLQTPGDSVDTELSDEEIQTDKI